MFFYWGKDLAAPSERTLLLIGALGGFLIVLSLLAGIFPPSWTLVGTSTACGLVLALTTLQGFHVDPFVSLEYVRYFLFPPQVGIWRFDPKLGYDHIPNATGVHESIAYKVSYTIDAEGCRWIPQPEKPRGRVLFVGASFTFGTGVEDDQCYPYLLGTRYWKDYEIKNRSVSGWGTSHVYLVLQDELGQTIRPTLVFYGWIPLHRHRNYIRKDWVRHLESPWTPFENKFSIHRQRKHPHFEIENGNLVYKGVVGFRDLKEDSPDILKMEKRLSKKLLIETVRLVRERGVPFILLILPMPKPYEIPDYLWEAIHDESIPFIDLRRVEKGFISRDFHPNAATHAALAAAIAEATLPTSILYPERVRVLP